MNEYGAGGIGEIGLTGCASALTSATYHATGVRVRELPIRQSALKSCWSELNTASSAMNKVRKEED
jgi:CO/xanthine dehydrogenase Mo-binding subunit